MSVEQVFGVRLTFSLRERTPKMSKQEWDLPELPAEHRVNETSAVQVKLGGTAASFFEHLRLAPSGKIPVHDMTSLFQMSCRQMDWGIRSEPREHVRRAFHAVSSEIRGA
jgi:hypothetical protein